MRSVAVQFSRLGSAAKQASVAEFARTLSTHQGRFVLTGKTAIELALMARGINNILVGHGSSPEQLSVRLNQTLGITIETSVVLPDHAVLLYNVPEIFAREGALLLTTGSVEQAATPESQYTRLTLAEVEAGRTDFGDDVVDFMKLNKIEFIDVLTQLTQPRYSQLGFAGSVLGRRLGMGGNVGAWSTVRIGVKESCGLRCYHCVIACPAGAIIPFNEKRGGVKIEPDACKGCQLCVEACPANTFIPGVKSE